MFRKLTKGACAGIAFFGATYVMSGNEMINREMIMPCLHKIMEPEDTHDLALKMVKYRFLFNLRKNLREYPELKTRVLDWTLQNPIGLAAGFDKNAEAIHNLGKLGYGFFEIGTVTPHAQPGNKPPRLFLLEKDKGLVNSYGFNNIGFLQVLDRVHEYLNNGGSDIFGINIGKNKESDNEELDYSLGVETFAGLSSYITLNVSSPNTPGLRDLQDSDRLQKILSSIQKLGLERPKILLKTAPGSNKGQMECTIQKFGLVRPKIFLKIAPDLTKDQMECIAKVALNQDYGISGLIVTNTTVSRPSSLLSKQVPEIGGLSGRPLKDLSTNCISELYKMTNGKVLIIGSGGIESGEDAYEKIKAGASLLQIYTAMVYQGFPVVGKIKRELANLIKNDGFNDVSEVVGINHRDSRQP